MAYKEYMDSRPVGVKRKPGIIGEDSTYFCIGKDREDIQAKTHEINQDKKHITRFSQSMIRNRGELVSGEEWTPVADNRCLHGGAQICDSCFQATHKMFDIGKEKLCRKCFLVR